VLPPDRDELRRRVEARGRRGQERWPERERILRVVLARLLDEDETGKARSAELRDSDRPSEPP
jgi:hypothetical protein